MNDVMHMFILVHVMSGGQAVGQKSHIYHLYFHNTNTFLYNIFTAPNMSASQALMLFY